MQGFDIFRGRRSTRHPRSIPNVAALAMGLVLLIGEPASAVEDGPAPDRPFVFAREVWSNAVSPQALRDPMTFAVAPDRSEIVSIPVGADGLGDGFVQVIRGWIEAPTTGAYRFAISADDDAVLLLDPDGDPRRAVEVAKVTGFTDPGDFSGEGQTSRPVTLVKGQRCYVEARHRDVAGEDHLSIGWKVPRSGVDRPIPLGCVIEPRFLFEAWMDVPQQDPGGIDAFERKPDRRAMVIDLATPVDIGSSVATRLSGTWTAPRDGEYRFMLSADDLAILEVRSDEDPNRLLGSARLRGWTAPDSWDDRPGQATDPIPLRKGQMVRLQAIHSQGSGPGHAAVGVVGPGVSERPITSPVRRKGI